MTKVASNKKNLTLKALLTAKDLTYPWVRGKLLFDQNACRAKQMRVPKLVVVVLDSKFNVAAVRENLFHLKRSLLRR